MAQQGDSASTFRVDYLKRSGAIGFYHPDWVVVQKTDNGEVKWIIETKGRFWPGTEVKYEAITDWCERISAQTKRLGNSRPSIKVNSNGVNPGHWKLPQSKPQTLKVSSKLLLPLTVVRFAS